MVQVNSVITAIVLALFFVLFGCNDGDNWVEEELNNTTCNNNLTTIFSYNNSLGVVTTGADANNDTYYLRINNPDSVQVTEYCLPCNLPEAFKIENLQIRFNGDLKSMAGIIPDPDDEILIIAQPLTLTRLWVIK